MTDICECGHSKNIHNHYVGCSYRDADDFACKCLREWNDDEKAAELAALESRVIELEAELNVCARESHFNSPAHNGGQVGFESCHHRDCKKARATLQGAK